MTSVAPAARAASIVTRPMGPAPATRTVSPVPTSPRRQAWMPTESGSHRAPSVVETSSGKLVGEISWPGDVLREGAVVGRRRHERYRLAEVVVTALAVRTAPARDAGFEGDAVAGFEAIDVVADLDDFAGALVTKNEGSSTT